MSIMVPAVIATTNFLFDLVRIPMMVPKVSPIAVPTYCDSMQSDMACALTFLAPSPAAAASLGWPDMAVTIFLSQRSKEGGAGALFAAFVLCTNWERGAPPRKILQNPGGLDLWVWRAKRKIFALPSIACSTSPALFLARRAYSTWTNDGLRKE